MSNKPEMKSPDGSNRQGLESVNVTHQGNVTMNSVARIEPIAIEGIAVRTDDAGRYCLNDLHKAAGGEDRHQPANFLRNQQTIDLIGILKSEESSPIVSKQGLGTFVCRELVYAYAMWISPAFHLKVIRTFDAMATGQVQPVDPMTALSDPQALRGLLLGYSEKVIALEHKVEAMQPDVDALTRLSKSDGSLCITDAAKTLQMRPKDLFAWLRANKWIYKRPGCAHDCAYQDKIQMGYLEHKTTEVTQPDGTTKIREQVRITPKGLTVLAKRMQGEAA